MKTTPRTRIFNDTKEYETFQNYTSHTYPDPSKNTLQTSDVTVLVNSHFAKMDDYVVPSYKKRSAAGEIFNNPLHKIDDKLQVSPLTETYRNEEADGHIRETVVISSPYVPPQKVGFLDLQSSEVETAITASFANISANEQNLVLWLGESRETVKMLHDIGAAALKLWNKTAKERKLWAKGKLTIPEMQSLTLGLLYGVLPLEQQIAAFYDGLTKIKEDGRHTSRGFGSVSKDNSSEASFVSKTNSNLVTNIAISRESLEVEIRAGVLFDVNASDFPLIAILADPKQIVETAYALARLSFVIDWFLNVGNTLKAWSPSAGVTRLASWVTIEQSYTRQISYVSRQKPGYPRITTSATGRYVREIKKVDRIPTTVADVGILPNINLNLNLDKIFALILLFAKSGKS